MTTLKAEGSVQEVILAYINENASEALTEKINKGTKTLADCVEYIKSEAKKLASNGSTMVTDNEVFGWAMHFFEEDSIKAGQKVQARVEVKKPEPVKAPEPKKVEKKTEAAGLEGQMSLEDLFGGM